MVKAAVLLRLDSFRNNWALSREILDDCYMLHIAYLDPESRHDVEKKYIHPVYEITNFSKLDTVDDWKRYQVWKLNPRMYTAIL